MQGRRWSEVVKGKYKVKKPPLQPVAILPRGVPLPKAKFVPYSPPPTENEEDQVTYQPEVEKQEQEPQAQTTVITTSKEEVSEVQLIVEEKRESTRYHHPRRTYDVPLRKKTIFVFLDLEMTGLKSSTNRILEVAVLLSDPSLRDLGIFHAVRYLEDPELETWSKKTHASNYLLEAVANSEKSIETIDQELCEFITKSCGGKPEDYILMPSGMSINNDLKFVENELPNFFTMLHYETLELSGIRKLVRLFCPRLRHSPPRFIPLHRAVPDVYSAFQLFLFYLTNLFRNGHQPHSRRLLEHNTYQEHVNHLMEDSSEYSSSWSAMDTSTTAATHYQPQPTTYFTPVYPYYHAPPPTTPPTTTTATTTGPIYAYPAYNPNTYFVQPTWTQ